MPSECAGTERVTGMACCDCVFNTFMLRLISASLRGASTIAEPRYVSSVNTVLSPSRKTNDVDIASDLTLEPSTTRKTTQYQAYSKYKHSFTFCVQCYVVIATKPVHQLQICPIVHNYRAPHTILPTYIWVRAVVWEWSEGQTHTHTQTAVTTRYISHRIRIKPALLHFAWGIVPHGKCNNASLMRMLYLLSSWSVGHNLAYH